MTISPPVRRSRRRSLAAIVAATAFVASVAPTAAAFAAEPLTCTQVSGAWLVDATCIDPSFLDIVVLSEADETAPVPHHRISATIGGSAVNIYLPPAAEWEGRFFQTTYPLQSAAATDSQIAFAIDSGAGLVQATGTAGYRLEAAAVKYAKVAASRYYASEGKIYAYLSGGSGGSYPTTGAMENTTGVWDGYVPFITGSPTAIPNNFFARAYARFVLEDKVEQISDAMKPGGSGDPFAGLSSLESSVLEEVTRFGLPLDGWAGPRYILGMDTPDSLLGFGGSIRALDRSYVTDFWNAPGYLGTEESELGDFFRAGRIVADATVSSVQRDSSGTATSLVLAGLPEIAKPWIPTDYSLVRADGTAVAVQGTLDPASNVFTLGVNGAEVLALLADGATLRVDNSWSLALFALPRYQTPSASDFHAWDQYRAEDGTPRNPVRAVRLGEIIAGSISGGAAYSGSVKGKVIIVDNLVDVDAYPWAGAWYADRAKAALGDSYDDNVRLWYFENSDHVGQDETRVLPYGGVLEQAFRDVAAWAEDGRAPAASTAYTVTHDAQITAGSDARTRGGIQPSVQLTVGGAEKIEVETGQQVAFHLETQIAPDQGSIVDVQWDFTGTGVYQPAAGHGSDATFAYDTPGTYFAAVRVTTDREGDVGDAFGQVKNLDRVRVVVRDGSAPDAAIAAEPVAPTGDNGWYTGPFIVSATAVDDFDPAPSIEVSIDGGEFGAYAGPIEVTTDGEHVISARATDASGKVSETAEWSAKLDSTSPSVTATATWSPKLVTLTATDETSGVARLEYAVLKKVGASPSDWKAYTGPIRISDRKTVIAYRATDVAGNISATSEFDFLSVKNGRDFPMAQPQ